MIRNLPTSHNGHMHFSHLPELRNYGSVRKNFQTKVLENNMKTAYACVGAKYGNLKIFKPIISNPVDRFRQLQSPPSFR